MSEKTSVIIGTIPLPLCFVGSDFTLGLKQSSFVWSKKTLGQGDCSLNKNACVTSQFWVTYTSTSFQFVFVKYANTHTSATFWQSENPRRPERAPNSWSMFTSITGQKRVEPSGQMRISDAKFEIFLCVFQMAHIVNSPDVFSGGSKGGALATDQFFFYFMQF